jgi:hypothetical protein
MTDEQKKDPIAELAATLADAIVGGDRALLEVIQALITRINSLEVRVFELECQLQEGPSPIGRRVN